MALLSKILRSVEGQHLAFWCPGCEQAHVICYAPGRWTWNGDAEKPTFSPSVLTTYRSPEGGGTCHSFVTDGRIQFLGDCTHALAGQTVDLLPWPAWTL